MNKYIDAEQAIETFKKVLPITPRSCGKTNIYMGWISALLEAWNNIPSVDVQPVVHGYWVEEPDRYFHWHCSECEYVISGPHKEFHYCPKCGTKMDGDRRMTNAERIREMTDEELADYILKRDIGIVDRLSQLQAFIYNFDEEKGKKDLLNWLKREIDNEHTD